MTDEEALARTQAIFEKIDASILKHGWDTSAQLRALVQVALIEASKDAIRAERAATINGLNGLMPIDGGPILDSARGALEDGIRLIRAQPYPWDRVNHGGNKPDPA